MYAEATQAEKNQRASMEKQLRLSGEKLDELWIKARNATGQTKTDLHNQIASLRKKQSFDREQHELFKKSLANQQLLNL